MRQAKLGRTSSHRRALLRHLATQVIAHGQVTTTEAKAKAVQPLVDKMISLGKRGDLHARRQAAAFLTKKEVVKKLFDEVAPKYATRNGGYRSEERRVGKEWEYRGGGWRVKKVE